MSDYYAINAGFKLQFEETQQSHVLLFPEGMVKINDSAAAILKLCDGTKDISQIIDELAEQFSIAAINLSPDVHEFIKTALDKKWIGKK